MAYYITNLMNMYLILFVFFETGSGKITRQLVLVKDWVPKYFSMYSFKTKRNILFIFELNISINVYLYVNCSFMLK